MAKKSLDFIDIIEIIGILLTIAGATIDSFLLIGIGAILIIIYIGDYIHKNYIQRMRRIEIEIKTIHNKIKIRKEFEMVKERIARLEGKKGVLDPITLIIIIIIILIIIYLIRNSG